ncbi:MAG: DUF814 domain-containing protein [Treponema sp.]|nr:DUF814 domain-containing protein [Treponema sp.]
MSLNCNEIDLILSELNLDGGFIQEVVQPNFNSLAFYTYRPGEPKTVFISLEAGACRIHETRRKITKNEKPLRFQEMLKSKIKGARILNCTQLAKERIIKLELEKAGTIYVMPQAQQHAAKKSKSVQTEDEDEIFHLYIRLWSNAGNIFLCNKDDIILDSFYRRPAKGEKTGEKLILPEEKKLSQEELKELEERFNVRTFEEVDFSGLQRSAQNAGTPLSFNQKIDFYYSENSAKTSLESLLEQAQKWYESHRSRLAASLERLKEKRETFRNAARYKHQGDLILAFGYKIDGKSNFLECEDYDTGKIISIRIDPKKSAQENAAEYYETYKKQTGGLENLDYDIESAEKELENLEKQYKEIISEKNPIKLEQVLRKTQKPKQQKKKSHPGLDFFIDGWQIIVGRDATENDELLRHTVKGADMWLHTRDYHGGYVFIKNRPGKTVPLEILLYAGNLAVYFSKARKNGSADLYYTQVKHLRRAKNAPKGTVLPTNEKNLFIKLDDDKIRKILNGAM